MSYKTIVVNLNDIERVSALMNVAISLSKKHDAHLIGLHVIPPFNMAAMAGPFGVSPEIINEYVKSRKALSEEIKKEYEKALEQDIVSSEWRCVDSWENWSERHLIKHSRCADLIVTGQGAIKQGIAEQTRITEHLILETGRPVLVIPHEGEFEEVGNYPLIAWNASQESTRAVFDALPFLVNSKETKVVWIDPDEPDEKIDVAGSEISTTLARHGVKVEAATINTEKEKIGESIVNQVRESASDLLIMGAYGHSRFQEYLFGGATKGVLKDMKVPVLLSH